MRVRFPHQLPEVESGVPLPETRGNVPGYKHGLDVAGGGDVVSGGGDDDDGGAECDARREAAGGVGEAESGDDGGD